MAWINDLQSSHWLSFLLKTSTHTRTFDEIVLDLVRVILPLAAVVALGIVEDQLALPRYHHLAVLVVQPPILPRHFVHLDGSGNSIFRVLIGNNFHISLITAFI